MPIQHDYFDRRQQNRHFFNLSILLQTPDAARPTLLRQALHQLYDVVTGGWIHVNWTSSQWIHYR